MEKEGWPKGAAEQERIIRERHRDRQRYIATAHLEVFSDERPHVDALGHGGAELRQWTSMD